MASIVQEKVAQAADILKEKGVDVWLTFVRETVAGYDPVLPMIFGEQTLTWDSAMLLTAGGESICLLGNLDKTLADDTGAYQTVIGYDQSIRELLLETIQRLDPQTIAINMSKDDVFADGLHHGMYLKLLDYLQDTPYVTRLVSSGEVVAALRGRKSPAEVERLRQSVSTAEAIYAHTFRNLVYGMSEADVAAMMQEDVTAMMQEDVTARGLTTAWAEQFLPGGQCRCAERAGACQPQRPAHCAGQPGAL